MFSFLNLMSNHKRVYTYIGNRTMYVYLLHGLVIGIVRGLEIYPLKDHISVFTLRLFNSHFSINCIFTIDELCL